MRSRLAFALLPCVFVFAAAVIPRAGAQCAEALAPLMLTPATASIPRDGGGIVIGMRRRPGAARPMPPGINLARGRRTQSLMPQRTIAPGLVRFAAATRLTTGPFTTTDLGLGESTLTIGRGPMPGMPTRPSVREMRRVAAAGMSATSTPRMEVRALLEFPVPAGIVAILSYWGESETPGWWRPAIQGQTEIPVWTEADVCDPMPEGSSGPPSEAPTGLLAYVDE